MNENESKKVEKPLPLSDELAIHRTSLANERTLLAYLRSGVALIIAGATMAHFSYGSWFLYLGAVCILGGVATGLIGTSRYARVRRSILQLRNEREKSD